MKSYEELNEIYNNGSRLLSSGDYEAASEIFISLTDTAFAPFAYYRLAAISNLCHDPVTAKDLYYKAFKLKPDLCQSILPETHANHSYVFRGKMNEPLQERCALCGEKGKPHWCYSVIEMGSPHVQSYNPVRLWMRCDNCNHLYAEEFPEPEVAAPKDISRSKAKGMPTKPQLFSFYSEVLTNLSQYTTGINLLEIGIGGSECSLAAAEMGYDVFGIDILEGNVVQARNYGLIAELHDFVTYETEKNGISSLWAMS